MEFVPLDYARTTCFIILSTFFFLKRIEIHYAVNLSINCRFIRLSFDLLLRIGGRRDKTEHFSVRVKKQRINGDDKAMAKLSRHNQTPQHRHC